VTSIVAGITDVLRSDHVIKNQNDDHHDDVIQDQDDDLVFPSTTHEQLLQRCQQSLNHADLPTTFCRNWSVSFPQHTSSSEDLKKTGTNLRIFQWNILAQAIGTKLDNFRTHDPRILEWNSRRWRILEEILLHCPDIICLQEVDHYKFISSALHSIGYSGSFKPKPDSACNYVQGNNGPDGVAIFYKNSKFELLKQNSKILEAFGSETNQVCLSVNLRVKESEENLCVVTTHLKARKGELLADIRNQQGKDLLSWIETVRDGASLLVTGDFNAEPSEAVYETVTNNVTLPLTSSYSFQDSDFTTWKIRDTGEEKHVLDYIFHSTDIESQRNLDMPAPEDIGVHKLPSLHYASDHLSLVSDVKIVNKSS